MDDQTNIRWPDTIYDHFKRVDDDTVMGIMNGKAALQDGRLGYFYLQRV